MRPQADRVMAEAELEDLAVCYQRTKNQEQRTTNNEQTTKRRMQQCIEEESCDRRAGNGDVPGPGGDLGHGSGRAVLFCGMMTRSSLARPVNVGRSSHSHIAYLPTLVPRIDLSAVELGQYRKRPGGAIR
jgi:hypothetical protein